MTILLEEEKNSFIKNKRWNRIALVLKYAYTLTLGIFIPSWTMGIAIPRLFYSTFFDF
jgi:hypothetical protein